jgi:hypothetical protein
MPKVDIDYSNTLFYKISCKDTSVSEVYIGHSTNFVQRKSSHKQSCNNPNNNNYSCKLYKFIRDNGGWDNWRMDIIAHHECNDHYDARKKEQELFLLYKATLNSIEPMPRPKPSPAFANDINPIKSTHTCEVCKFSCFNTLDVFTQHLTRNKHIKAANRATYYTGKDYMCEICDFKCSKNSNYSKHLITAKHLNRTMFNQKNEPNRFVCDCGKRYNARNSLWYHKRVCKFSTEDTILENTMTSTHLSANVDAALVIELLKQNQDLKESMIEQYRQMAERGNKLIDAVNDRKISNINCTECSQRGSDYKTSIVTSIRHKIERNN